MFQDFFKILLYHKRAIHNDCFKALFKRLGFFSPDKLLILHNYFYFAALQ